MNISMVSIISTEGIIWGSSSFGLHYYTCNDVCDPHFRRAAFFYFSRWEKLNFIRINAVMLQALVTSMPAYA
jgi:hypothetical protein